MRFRSIGWFAMLAALALAPAACRSAPEPSPAPAPAAAAPSTPAPDRGVPAAAPPVAPVAPLPAHRRGGAARCAGAIVHRIDAADTGRPLPRLCIEVGGVLRVENLGPGGLKRGDPRKADCYYEAGIHECRLIRTGTVRFTVVGRTGTLTVVIAKASSPPKPAPACLNAGAVHSVDATGERLPWPSLCMKLGGVLRVENLGPDRLAERPAGAVSCHYEAGIHNCRFVKPATVTFTVNGPGAPRTLTVVAVR